jgi:hypothetical protein
MVNIYYTARTGKRNANGHTITRGRIWQAKNSELVELGEYVHYSGGEPLLDKIISVVGMAGALPVPFDWNKLSFTLISK